VIVPRRTKKIPLRNRAGGIIAYTLVDTDDYERVVAAGPWHLNTGYAEHSCGVVNGKHLKIKLHRFVLNLPPGRNPTVDHISWNKLDNRKSKLRVGTQAENCQNKNIHNIKKSSSKYRGVFWDKESKKWRVITVLRQKRYNLGYFTNEEEAARIASEWRAEHMPFSADARQAQRSA
jgi:hypothetical protein